MQCSPRACLRLQPLKIFIYLIMLGRQAYDIYIEWDIPCQSEPLFL